jgi:hypothetical protein
MQNTLEDADRKVTFFINFMLHTLNSSLVMIQNLSYKINNKDIDNSNLYFIVFACDKLAVIVNSLPDNEFNNFFKTLMKKKLSKLTCYVIDNNSKITCNDFYEIFLKRKRINEEILSKVKLQKGGFGGLLGIAIAALALLTTATSVSGAVFSGDDLVQQSNALRGLESTYQFKDFLKKKSAYGSHTPLTDDERSDFAQLDANIIGVCMVNSFVAEICTGGCPSPEQWAEVSPVILQRIKDHYSDRPAPEEEHFFVNWEITPPNNLLLGAYAHEIYGIDFVNVPNGTDMEWFKNYFSDGAKEHFFKEQSSADLAIATVNNNGHAFNVLFNMNNKKLCVHDENYKVGHTMSGTLEVMFNSKEYICETGFFEKYQIDELNRFGDVVIETDENIFEVYNKENSITDIQPTESIFLLDNSKNIGNTNQYIEILKDVRRSIIEGERDSIDFFKENRVRLNITMPDAVLNILTEIADTHEESFNISRSPDGARQPFDPSDTIAKNDYELLHKLQTAFNPFSSKEFGNKPMFKGGNKICFTSKFHKKIKKRMSKKCKKK